jgi:Na+-transporting methylmalonyl-CoA/oxaloacetate decarboxylase gamma subunit
MENPLILISFIGFSIIFAFYFILIVLSGNVHTATQKLHKQSR